MLPMEAHSAFPRGYSERMDAATGELVTWRSTVPFWTGAGRGCTA